MRAPTAARMNSEHIAKLTITRVAAKRGGLARRRQP